MEHHREPSAPALTGEVVATLTRNAKRYSKRKRFRLALLLILGVRHEELDRVTKKEVRGNAILIQTVKRDPKR